MTTPSRFLPEFGTMLEWLDKMYLNDEQYQELIEAVNKARERWVEPEEPVVDKKAFDQVCQDLEDKDANPGRVIVERGDDLFPDTPALTPMTIEHILPDHRHGLEE